MKRNLALATVAAASALALTFGTVASAATVYSLSSLNLSGYPAPYGSVSVNLTSPTMATVTFTSDNVGIYDYFFIDSSAADVNVNATTWTITSLTTNGLNGATLTDSGSGQVDGWGTFNQTTLQTDGYADRSTLISFVLTDTSGTWANSDSVLIANSLGNTVGAHIAVCDTSTNPTCNSTIGAVATGFATNGTGRVPIPEPATWAMMVIGFGGLGAVLRSKRRRQRLAIA
jgi:hypothetical protein